MQPPVFTGTPGVVPDMSDGEPVDFFRLFFDERVIQLLLDETTRYANQYLQRETEHLRTHPHVNVERHIHCTCTIDVASVRTCIS